MEHAHSRRATTSVLKSNPRVERFVRERRDKTKRLRRFGRRDDECHTAYLTSEEEASRKTPNRSTPRNEGHLSSSPTSRGFIFSSVGSKNDPDCRATQDTPNRAFRVAATTTLSLLLLLLREANENASEITRLKMAGRNEDESSNNSRKRKRENRLCERSREESSRGTRAVGATCSTLPLYAREVNIASRQQRSRDEGRGVCAEISSDRFDSTILSPKRGRKKGSKRSLTSRDFNRKISLIDELRSSLDRGASSDRVAVLERRRSPENETNAKLLSEIDLNIDLFDFFELYETNYDSGIEI